jgi:hypothetical protein
MHEATNAIAPAVASSLVRLSITAGVVTTHAAIAVPIVAVAIDRAASHNGSRTTRRQG